MHAFKRTTVESVLNLGSDNKRGKCIKSRLLQFFDEFRPENQFSSKIDSLVQ